MTRYSERTGLPQEYQVGPFDSSHLYVQWGGKLRGGEEWSCGFRMWKSGGSAIGDAPQVLVNVASAIATMHARDTSGIGAQAQLSFVKVNAVGTNGRYLGDGTNEATFGDLPGGGGASTNPNQVALAVSLETGFTRGPAHRGRFFLPIPALPLDATGRLAAGVADMVRGSMATFRNAVNAGGEGHVMVVMSRKAGASGHRAVTALEVGSVMDTQRRRRNKLVEVY